MGKAITDGVNIGTGLLQNLFPGTFGGFSGQKTGSTIMNSSGYTPYGQAFSNYYGG